MLEDEIEQLEVEGALELVVGLAVCRVRVDNLRERAGAKRVAELEDVCCVAWCDRVQLTADLSWRQKRPAIPDPLAYVVDVGNSSGYSDEADVFAHVLHSRDNDLQDCSPFFGQEMDLVDASGRKKRTSAFARGKRCALMKAHQKSLTLRNHELIVFFFLVTMSHFSGVVTLVATNSEL